jgi:queuine tRNA-ribosyltransferase
MGTRQNAPITEKGITFKNPINGDKHLFTPEKSMAIQRWLGTDIRVVLDYFTDPKLSKEEKVRSVEITTRWANRAKEEWQKDPKSMIVAVVQGDTNLGLREKSLTGLKNIGFHGYGFGGWPIVNKKLDTKTLKHFCEITSTEHFTGSEVKYKSPFRYAMGIGTPDDIKRCVKMGFDLFDTVLPTRNARHGYLYSSKGTVRIKNAQYKNDFTAVDPNCECITCKFHTRAYLRYLFKKKSHLGYMFASLHNLHFYLQLMRDLREEIKRDTL